MNRLESNRKDITRLSLALVLLVLTSIISIGIGKYPIPISNIKDIILGRHVDSTMEMIFFGLRLPRTIMALIAGVGLSMAGNVYQTIFKNPLATPDIIGVSSGANLGAAVAIVYLSGGSNTIAIAAFVGGTVAVFTAIGLTRLSTNKGISTFVLAGIVIGSIAEGLIMMLKFFSDPERQLAAIEFWAMGSFASITQEKVLSILPYFLIGFILLILLRWQINILSLNDDEVRSLGVPVGFIRFLVIIAATLLVASIVSITGLIAFIGLIAPHIGRMITKRNDFYTTIFSGVIGGIILLIADTLARSIATSEIPISILTTFIGAPFLAYLMTRLDRR